MCVNDSYKKSVHMDVNQLQTFTLCYESKRLSPQAQKQKKKKKLYDYNQQSYTLTYYHGAERAVWCVASTV